MKFLKYSFLLALVIVCFSLCGCQDKNLIQPNIERDNYNTGGNLTFVYDEISHVATFGGEGEVVQFYEEDIAKGWDEKGNRIGFQIAMPKGDIEYKTGSAYFEDKKLNLNDIVKLQEGQNMIAIFQPIIKKDKEKYTLKITWEDGKNEQIYHIVIASGTYFMEQTFDDSKLEK